MRPEFVNWSQKETANSDPLIMNKLIIVLMSLFVSQAAGAKEVMLKAATVWAGVGGGTITVDNPATKLDSDGLNFLDAGGNVGLIGPLYLSIGASWGLATGKVQYDYTDPSNTHYTAANLPYSSTYIETRAGLQLRFADAGSFHFYVEGGGSLRFTDMTYDTQSNSSLASIGSTYQKEQKSIRSTGDYVEVGFDYLMKGWGFRVAGRASEGASQNVEALAQKRLFYKEGVGLAAVVHQF